MFRHLQRFIHWLNDDEPDNLVSIDFDTAKVPEGFVLPVDRDMLLHDEIIQDKLRVLKRSGLALPY